MRQVVLYQDEDGAWIAEIPSLPGCISEGETRDEALRNVAEAAQVWIEGMKELGQPIPPDPGTVEVATLPDVAA